MSLLLVLMLPPPTFSSTLLCCYTMYLLVFVSSSVLPWQSIYIYSFCSLLVYFQPCDIYVWCSHTRKKLKFRLSWTDFPLFEWCCSFLVLCGRILWLGNFGRVAFSTPQKCFNWSSCRWYPYIVRDMGILHFIHTLPYQSRADCDLNVKFTYLWISLFVTRYFPMFRYSLPM